MGDLKIENLKISEGVHLGVYNNKISINIEGTKKLAFANYEEDLLEIIKNARFRVPQTKKAIEDYKYLYSNEYKKSLHQIVFDYYFGEDMRAKYYEADYIIEHLDNDGFNCDISNLYFLKKIKNTYKGWNLDKKVVESLPVMGVRIYHIIENETFQISIVFNQTFINKESGKSLESIRLLYRYDYEIVLQDAELIVERILKNNFIDFAEWDDIFRYSDIEINYDPEIELTEEESKQPPGTFIFRDGKAHILIGESEDSVALINSIHYKPDWDLK